MKSVCIYSRPSSSKNPKQKTEISVFFCLSFLDSVLYLVFLLVSEILVLLWITFYFTKWKSYEKKMTWWDFLSVADSQEARLYSLSTLFARFKDIHFVVNYFLPQKVKVLWKKKKITRSVADSKEARLYSLSTLFAPFINILFAVNYFRLQKAEVSSFYFFVSSEISSFLRSLRGSPIIVFYCL